MSYYKPDNWVIIQIKGDKPHYKVLAGWSGGYAIVTGKQIGRAHV